MSLESVVYLQCHKVSKSVRGIQWESMGVLRVSLRCFKYLFWTQFSFWAKFFFSDKSIDPKSFMTQNNLFCPKIFSGQKLFIPKFFWLKFSEPKFFWSQKFLDLQYLDPKVFGFPNFCFGYKIIVDQKILELKKNWIKQKFGYNLNLRIFWTTNFFGLQFFWVDNHFCTPNFLHPKFVHTQLLLGAKAFGLVINFGTSRGPSSRSAYGWLTGSDVRSHYKQHYIFPFSFAKLS